MPTLKNFYHSLVPARVRYPIGRFRRGLGDRCRRLLVPGPLPPRRLLTRVQETCYVREYLEVGAKAAAAIRRAFAAAEPPLRILDFGCGLGRVLRHLDIDGWQLHGCDVDEVSLAWTRRAFPAAGIECNGERPPLAYADGRFDGVYSVSVFTHFDAGEQAAWAREMARVLRPGGLLALSTMGPRAFGNFAAIATPGNRRRLETQGFFFYPGGGDGTKTPFNARGAFHTAAGLERIFGDAFELERWSEGGLDGFQDLTLLRRRGDGDDGTGTGAGTNGISGG